MSTNFSELQHPPQLHFCPHCSIGFFQPWLVSYISLQARPSSFGQVEDGSSKETEETSDTVG